MALQEVVHVLRDTRNESSVLSHSFPKGKEEVCGVFVLEKQIDLVDKDIGLFALDTVLGDAVENTVKNDEHTHGHQRSSKLVNIVADKTIVGVHVGLLGEGVKASFRE